MKVLMRIPIESNSPVIFYKDAKTFLDGHDEFTSNLDMQDAVIGWWANAHLGAFLEITQRYYLVCVNNIDHSKTVTRTIKKLTVEGGNEVVVGG